MFTAFFHNFLLLFTEVEKNAEVCGKNHIESTFWEDENISTFLTGNKYLKFFSREKIYRFLIFRNCLTYS